METTAAQVLSDSRLEKTGESAWPAGEDRKLVTRLLERTLGRGFKLVVVEAASVTERREFTAWFAELLDALGGSPVEVELPNRDSDAEGLAANGFDLWAYLNEEIGKDGVGARTTLLVSGFEGLMYGGETPARPEILQQINVQRDLFVRDYPCWWVLFIHPHSRQAWYRTAPDFVDFAALWIENEAPAPSAMADTGVRFDRDRSTDRSDPSEDGPPEILLASQLESLSRYDEALDLLQKTRIGLQASPSDTRIGFLADVVEARVRFQRGEPQTALRLLEEASAYFASVGDARSVAVAWGDIADVLFQRGEVDEALRIRREECLPAFRALGDVQSLIVLRVQIAQALVARGDIEGDGEKIVANLAWAYREAKTRGLSEAEPIADLMRQLGFLDAFFEGL